MQRTRFTSPSSPRAARPPPVDDVDALSERGPGPRPPQRHSRADDRGVHGQWPPIRRHSWILNPFQALFLWERRRMDFQWKGCILPMSTHTSYDGD